MRLGSSFTGWLKPITTTPLETRTRVVTGSSKVKDRRPNPARIASARKLAVAALLRTEQRVGLLLDALEAKTVDRSVLSAEQVRALREHSNAELRARARKLLP